MLLDILKLGRPRTWTFVIFAFLIGWYLSTPIITTNFFTGLIVFILLVWNVNLVNAYTDKVEDRVNLPNRVKYIEEKIGYKNIPYFFVIIYIISTILAMFISSTFFLIYAITLFDTLFYSLKPLRFKTIPVLDLISFAGAVFLPMLGAWVINQGFYNIPPSLIFLGFWFLTYGTFKNLPDYEGDKSVGIRNFATVFSTRGKAIIASVILLLSPFVLLIPLLLYGFMEMRYVYLFLLFPILIFIIRKMLKSKSYERLEKIHTYGLIYAVLFLALTFILVTLNTFSLILTITILLMFLLIIKTKFDTR